MIPKLKEDALPRLSCDAVFWSNERVRTRQRIFSREVPCDREAWTSARLSLPSIGAAGAMAAGYPLLPTSSDRLSSEFSNTRSPFIHGGPVGVVVGVVGPEVWVGEPGLLNAIGVTGPDPMTPGLREFRMPPDVRRL